MNRHDRRALQKRQHAHVEHLKLPKELTRLPDDQIPSIVTGHTKPFEIWMSDKYLVQLYREHAGIIRMSVCSTQLSNDGFGRWEDRLPWDVLQKIKADVGYKDFYAVEVYPPEAWVINVANFRHLWICPLPLDIGWRPVGKD